jgi:hypothetical protein
MITIKDFMETVDYKITEGSEYSWRCFGPDARSMDSWNGRWDSEGHTMTMVFDTKTQVVYQMEAWDYKNEREYRWMNPDFKEAYEAESVHRGIDANESLDGRKFIDLETEADMLEKARAIVLGEDYDSRISIPLDMPDDELLVLMKMAHAQDITFNQLMVNVLQGAIDPHKAPAEEVINTPDSFWDNGGWPVHS